MTVHVKEYLFALMYMENQSIMFEEQTSIISLRVTCICEDNSCLDNLERRSITACLHNTKMRGSPVLKRG